MPSAESYDALWRQSWTLVQAVGPLTRTRYRLIRKELEPFLEPGSQILDAGCGNGTLLATLAARISPSSLYGIEFSEAAITGAPSLIRSRIAHGDLVTELPRFFDSPVDILISSEVLEHVVDPTRILAMMRGALKPGGVAVLTVPARMRWWSSQDVFAGHVQRFEPQEFRAMIERAGLRVQRLYCWGIGPALFYDRLTSWIGPRRAIAAGRSRLGRWTASMLFHLFKMEDWVPSTEGFQLVAVARHE